MKWTLENSSNLAAAEIKQRYNLSAATSLALASRGATRPQDLKFYLCPELSMLHNPFLFDDMEDFCARMLAAVEGHEKVFIFGDRDADGVTATVLMATELERLGLEVSYKLPEGDERYGMTMEGVQRARESGATLLVTVDCGISSFDEVERARELGMDTLILDHHLAGDELPSALAIIDPKIPGCGYPFDGLAACAVVAKCVWALRFAMTEFHNRTFRLLHCSKKEHVVVIEAAKLENLVEIDKVVEEVVPGLVRPEDSKALAFLGSDGPVLVLDAPNEKALLDEAFGKGRLDASLYDLRSEFEACMPIVRRASLFGLSLLSKESRFLSAKSELATLCAMFRAYVRLKRPLLGAGYAPLMDLVAIGTVADLMPMRDENRAMVRAGLSLMERSPRPSVRALLIQLNLAGKPLKSSDIGWQIGPCINAAGRLGDPGAACRLLLATDPKEAAVLAQNLVRLNNERKRLSEVVWNEILPQAQKSFESMGSKLVAVSDPSVKRGVTGIIATRLLKRFKAPAVVVSGETGGIRFGSIRSEGAFDARAFIARFSDLLLDYGGHKAAGGFSLEADKDAELLRRIAEEADWIDCPSQEEEALPIDAIIPPDSLTPALMETVDLLEPYGEGNPPPIFLIQRAKVARAEVVRANNGPVPHLKLTIGHGPYLWPAILWNGADKLGHEFSEGDEVDLAFRLSRTFYRNQEGIQMTVMGIEKAR